MMGRREVSCIDPITVTLPTIQLQQGERELNYLSHSSQFGTTAGINTPLNKLFGRPKDNIVETAIVCYQGEVTTMDPLCLNNVLPFCSVFSKCMFTT